MKKFLVILIILSFSCQEDDLPLTGEFEVVVSGMGADCNLILIDFPDEALSSLKNITGSDQQRYYAFNLDHQYNQQGLKLRVKVRKTSENEYYLCTTLGPAYPWVTVIKAEVLN